MNRNLILIPAASLILSLFMALFAPPRRNIWFSVIALLLSLVNAVSAGLALFAMGFESAQGQRFNLVLEWLSFGETSVMKVAFDVQAWNSLLWVLFSLWCLISEYLCVVSGELGRQGHRITRSLLAIGGFLSILSGNLMTFYFGWSIGTAAAFLGITLSASPRAADLEQFSSAASRYLAYGFIAAVVFFCGALGISINFGDLSFADLSTAASVPEWAMPALLGGALGMGLQLPFLSRARFAGTADDIGPSLLLLAHVMPATILLSRLAPLFEPESLGKIYSLVPALSCLFAAMAAMAERDWNRLMGWFAAYLCGCAGLELLNGGYLSAQMTVMSGGAALFLLFTTRNAVPFNSRARFWLWSLALAGFMGVPITGLSQARVFEYAAIIRMAQDGHVASWGALAIKALADMMIVIAAWRLLRGPGVFAPKPEGRNKQSTEIQWQRVWPLGLSALLNFSMVLGGRPFSGVFGEPELELAGRSAWLEPLVAVLGTGQFVDSSSEAEVSARILLVGVFALPTILALVWFFRDEKSAEEFSSRWSRLFARVDLERFLDRVLWDYLARPVSAAVGRVVSYFDLELLSTRLPALLAAPVVGLSKAVQRFDGIVVDKTLTDGVGAVVLQLGRALRVLQNGNAQFYVAFGLIVTGVVLLNLILKLGG